jgi:parallel beta-helix repeat protein
MRWTRIRGMTALIVTLAIVLALSLGLWSHWTASAQDTFLVNDDTTPAVDGCDTPDFETEDIQDAIDSGLVAGGDTLVICEGTYNSPNVIAVAKSLTIEGRAAADRDDIVVQGVADEDGFLISVDGVTVRHLKVAGADSVAGIRTRADDGTIQDLDVSAFAAGIFIDDAEGNVVEDCDTHDNLAVGIHAEDGANNIIRNNESTANPVGVHLALEDNALVEGNALTENIDHQIWLDQKLNVRVLRNTITTVAGTDGILMDPMPAESLVIIGGRAQDANSFSGPFEPAGGDYYVQLACASENTVDATYNWWGVTNRTDIANRIFNDEDDPSSECPAPDDVKGAVVFHPWATGPAPTPTPSPTPSPTATATATGTPTPTATPGATRTIDLSPQGWHDLAWSGTDGTDPGTALACIAGKYSIAYAWEGPTAGFKRYVEGCAIPGICNMAALDKYDTLLVNITAAASCVMPVAP